MPKTVVVDIKESRAYEYYVGPPVKGDSHSNVREGSGWAAGYIRHHSSGDWRDIQVWRYFSAVLRKLLTDPEARKRAKMMRGKVLGAKGEQGVRCAEILAWIIDHCGIFDSGVASTGGFREGFVAALDGESRPPVEPMDKYTGYMQAHSLLEKRHEVCGVASNWEDPAGDADEEYHHA